MKLRPYQKRIINAIGNSNAIVVMPTGSGKTIVAADIVGKVSGDKSKASLFIVPTQDLVEQQSRVLERWCPHLKIHRFTGGMVDPVFVRKGLNCLVCTPQAFRFLQGRKSDKFGWERFCCVVFDEVHHVLKDHPFRHIALQLRARPHNLRNDVQVLGFSASLTYAIGEEAITKTLARLCRDMQTQKMLSPSIQELEEGGYIPPHGRNVVIERCNETPEGVTLPSQRKPHLMHAMFMKRAETGCSTEFTKKVLTCVRSLEAVVKHEIGEFESPLGRANLSSWEDYANKLNQRHKSLALDMLEHWYVGLRLLVQSWEEEEQLVLQWLKMRQGIFTFPGSRSEAPQAMEMLEGLSNDPNNFFKLSRLKFHLEEKLTLFGESFRCIIFVQQRITAVILSNWINEQNLRLHSGFVAARESRITPTLKATKSMVTQTIEEFRAGHLNVIVATSVVEEGFDVPEANVVISYDHLKNAVELCQRFGRARDAKSSIVVLDERQDRPMEVLEAAKAQQESIVNSYDAPNDATNGASEEEKKSQVAREKTAYQQVLQDMQKWTESPTAALNLYVKKTKALLTETFSQGSGNSCLCTLKYTSIIRTNVEAKGTGPNKKAAKRDAAMSLLRYLKEGTQTQIKKG